MDARELFQLVEEVCGRWVAKALVWSAAIAIIGGGIAIIVTGIRWVNANVLRKWAAASSAFELDQRR